RRWRPVFWSGLLVLGLWTVVLTGYSIAKNHRVTLESLKAHVQSIDLNRLSRPDRAKVIRKLTDMLNGLSYEERQKARLERLTFSWLSQMTEDEKGQFIESTMPTGFKQMLTAFEQLPEDKRRKSVDDALRRLRESQRQMQASASEDDQPGTNGPP